MGTTTSIVTVKLYGPSVFLFFVFVLVPGSEGD